MAQARNIPAGPAISGNAISQYLFYRAFINDPLGKVNGWFDEYGDTFCIRVGEKGHQYMTADPDFIREVTVKQADIFIKGPDYTDETQGMARFLGSGLLTSNGDFWKRQRKLVAPAFHTKRIDAYADTMVSYTQRMLEKWQDGAVHNIDHDMMQLTLMIVARTLFDVDATDTVDRVASAVDSMQEMMNDPTLIPRWLPTPKNLRHRRAVETLDEIVYGFIRERRAHMEDKGDLLSMLLLTVDEEDGKGMTDKQVRDEAVTLFLAGHETTANALNWTWFLLANNPQIEAKLHQELDTVLAGKAPTLADLRRLPYTEMVIKESMRLYPPAWSFGRNATEDTMVQGYSIPRGTNINIVSYRLHRHAGIWNNPNDFIPERWSAENSENIPRYAYMPFGGGPRVCIGNSFAMMEANLLLATMAQQFQLRVKEGAKIVPQPFITLFPRDGMPMRLEKRHPQYATESPAELEMV